jgi:hypothetical protein
MARVEKNGKLYDAWDTEAQELIADIAAVETQHVERDTGCSEEEETGKETLLKKLNEKCENYLVTN